MTTIKVIQPVGILDGVQATQIRREVADVVEQDAGIVLIDLKDVTFVDSSGLGALVVALRTVRAAGGKLYICSINDQVKMLFELTSMNQVFEVFIDQAEFNQQILLVNPNSL
ncbi:MAG: STAS domain-containing protein [Leptolyngbyaceae cyanobacterium RM2_2_4]|nr:STAS domain-containing protein [Leptolyngbyaceae cyanobacterium SM1_4_3]NJN56320.1 STAS domain-containing protein [Leptolyngbyaceae cyanobacterium SL_5_9]NJO48832.1 STAS domain-containing protein [Leptolyngbyaceae cyanobacterium RM2_2_4]